MYKILTYKQLTFLAVFLSAILVFASLVNFLSPSEHVNAEKKTPVPIIMYHQISNNKNLFGKYVIPPSLLEEDFKYLKENDFTPISFNDLKKFVNSKGTLPKKPIIITFDDGEKSFLTKVVPLLEKYNFPGNINIVGSLTEQYTKSGETDDRYAYLNMEDIISLTQNPLVEIGCHTYNLHSLESRRGMEKLKGETLNQYENFIQKDLNNFNLYFKDVLKKQTDIFAYPYGIRNTELLEILKKNNYKITLTCDEKINYIGKNSSLYELGRFNRPFKESTESFFNRILKEKY